MNKHISSTTNPLVKQLLQLKLKSKLRKTSGLFVIEGQREISLALAGRYEIEVVFYLDNFPIKNLPDGAIEYISLSQNVYEKVAHRGTTEGLLAIAKVRNHQLTSIELNSKNPLILVAEAPEKPGNIGALLRTADAAQLDAVIIANPKTDLYNPNIIRSSVGCLFTLPIATGNTEEVIAWLQNKGIRPMAAALDKAESYLTADYTSASALVVGTEDEGLSDLWLKAAHKIIKIPMSGQIDSMNVSVAAAVLIFEAKRQRAI